nr:biotin/lipoate A/B protein ligase family protein [Pseudoclavibacter sp. Marseille-Q3772]
MHGEYKVPGGKLVIVDLDVRDDRLADVRVAGDFFLEPDDALEQMGAALNGMPASASHETLTEVVRTALPEDAQLLGFSPEAVAVVVRRAILGARDWREYDWQIVRHEPLPAAMQVALDQVLTEEVAAGRRKPTLRFWEWNESAAIIGSFQSVRNEVDVDAAARYGVQVLRRISGGGAMFMEAGSVVTYSLYLPGELVAGMSFAESYAFLDAWVLEALHEVGINARYEPLNDIASPQGKIGGAAQKRLGSGAVLHHATLSYDIDADRMLEVLRIGREKMSDKGHQSAKKRVSPLKSQTGMPRDEIIDVFARTFASLHGGVSGSLTDAELARARELVETKFTNPEWVYRVP